MLNKDYMRAVEEEYSDKMRDRVEDLRLELEQELNLQYVGESFIFKNFYKCPFTPIKATIKEVHLFDNPYGEAGYQLRFTIETANGTEFYTEVCSIGS